MGIESEERGSERNEEREGTAEEAAHPQFSKVGSCGLVTLVYFFNHSSVILFVMLLRVTSELQGRVSRS